MAQVILIIDDEALIRRILSEEFQDHGYEVLVAAGGEEALKILHEERVDLVISDVQMPNLTGMQVLSRVQHELASPPPVILVTAFSEKTIQEALAAGAQGVFSKPIDFEQLVLAVGNRLLPLTARFCPDQGTAEPQCKVKLTFANFDQSQRDHHFSIGTGGFFVACQENFPKVGQTIEFDITFSENHSHLKGRGMVRWTRRQRKSDLLAGCGVQILTLDELSINSFQA